MNFLGHACVAGWYSDSPALALGSMLPDFAAMTGVRVTGASDPELERGIALHHRTDSAFHTGSVFLRLYRDGASELRARGLARGPARGAAHVGVELLLDAAVGARPGVGELFHAALDHGRDASSCIAWAEAEGPTRWLRLTERLRAAGREPWSLDAELVAERVARALGRRPRLRLAERDGPALRDWLHGIQDEVALSAPPLLDELATALEPAVQRLGLAGSPARLQAPTR